MGRPPHKTNRSDGVRTDGSARLLGGGARSLAQFFQRRSYGLVSPAVDGDARARIEKGRA